MPNKNLPVVFFILSMTSALLSGCNDSSDTPELPPEQQAKHVWAIELKDPNKPLERHLTGQLQAADSVPISFEVSGVINQLNVDLGEAFNQGDVLASLDDAIFDLNVKQQQSALAEAKAAMSEANLNLNRNQQLREQGLVSQSVLDNAQTSFDIAQQRVEVAQSRLNIALENLKDTKLIAPYDGKVSARLAEPSQQISPAMPVLEIQGNQKLEVGSAIPESIINKVELFDSIDVKIPSLDSNKIFEGVLTEIGAQASLANAFPITVTLQEEYPGFYPGMSAELIIKFSPTVSASEGFIVPVSAYATDKQGPYIYIIDERQTLRQKRIQLLDVYKNEVLISATDPKANLIADTSIVKTGLAFLENGQRVQIVGSGVSIYNQ